MNLNCKKCGGVDIRIRFINEKKGYSSTPTMPDITEEHLRCICNRCEYSWSQKPNDAGED